MNHSMSSSNCKYNYLLCCYQFHFEWNIATPLIKRDNKQWNHRFQISNYICFFFVFKFIVHFCIVILTNQKSCSNLSSNDNVRVHTLQQQLFLLAIIQVWSIRKNLLYFFLKSKLVGITVMQKYDHVFGIELEFIIDEREILK